MPKVMFEMTALGFQRIVLFVFDFPARSSNLGQVNHIGRRNRVIGDEAVLVQDFARTFRYDDQFQPINQ